MRRIVVMAGIAALLLAACGQSQSPQERLAASTEATSSTGSAEFSMEIAMEMGAGGSQGSSQGASGMDMTVSGEGVMDFEAQQGRLTLEVPGLGSGMETIYDGDAVYTRMPAALTGGEAQWLRQTSPGFAQSMTSTSGVGGDPTEMLEALGAADGEIEELGTDDVRGESVDGYGFSITPAELQGGQDVPEQLTDLQIPVEAWLDSDDRLRRMVTEIDMGQVTGAAAGSAPEGSEGAQALEGMAGAISGTMTMTMELWNFGTSVEIQPPDDAEVIDASELQGRGLPGAGQGS